MSYMAISQLEEDKKKLRTCLQKKRNALTPFERNLREKQLVAHICKLDVYKFSQCIVGYVPTKKELSPLEFFKQAMRDGKEIFIPLPDQAPLLLRQMHEVSNKHYYVARSGQTTKILVPRCYDSDIPIKNMLCANRCMIIIPGLGFSRDGKRIGRGGGFYDRLLTMPYTHNSVGICFREQLCGQGEIPVGEFDRDVRFLVAV